MSLRVLTAAVAAALALPAAAPAAPPPKVTQPAVVAQAQPGGRLIEHIKQGVRAFGGDDAAKAVETGLKDALGEKGLTGIDLLRAPAAYAVLAAEGKDCWGALVIPVTSEKEFLDLVDRLGCTVEAKKDAPGLYAVTRVGDRLKSFVSGATVLLRVHDGAAYVGVNAKPDALDPKSLPPLAALVDPAETAVVAVHLDAGRLDPALTKLARETVDQFSKTVEAMAGGLAPPPLQGLLKPAVRTAAGTAGRVIDDGGRAALRVRMDDPATEFAYEFTLAGKPGSKLAADIAAYEPPTTRFAGLVPDTGVGGALLRLPLSAPEYRAAAAGAVEAWFAAAADDLPPVIKPAATELKAGLARTIKAGGVDLGIALTGPDKDGHYTAVAGVGYDDPSGLEKALRAVVKDLPAQVRAAIKFDAAKVGDRSAHTAAVGELLPREAQRLFGEEATAAVVFAPAAVYAAVGPDALVELTRVTALKPGPARFQDWRANPAKLRKLATLFGPDFAAVVESFPTEDRLVSLGTLEARGGAELTVRYSAYPALGRQQAR